MCDREVVDAQGDIYSPEEIRQAAHPYCPETRWGSSRRLAVVVVQQSIALRGWLDPGLREDVGDRRPSDLDLQPV